MTTRDFIYKVLKGETRKDFCSSVYASTDADGQVTVYSYGYHYPLAKIINGVGFVNNRGYSNTTAKHINWAFDAISDIVGYANTYGVPLTDGDSLTKRGLLSSATRELERITKEMASKKRKDTQVYANLERDQQKMAEAVKAVKGLNS